MGPRIIEVGILGDQGARAESAETGWSADSTTQKPILIVTRNLPPLVGGMERLNWHIADELSRHAEVHVIGPTGAAAVRPERVQLSEVPLRPLWKFLLASALKAVTVARRIEPEVILAGSGLTAPAALIAARATGARAAVYLHGLDVAVRHPVYRALWHPTIRRMDTVIANSRPTAELAKHIGVDASKTHIVHPGVQLPTESQSADALQDFRQRYNLGNARLLLSVGRLAARKGLREFVANALPEIVRNAPDVLLVIVGDTPSDALAAETQDPASIQNTADVAGIGQHLRFLGRISERDLPCAYECAAVQIFPVRDIPGDPEGFGMVAIEAAAHGLPTVAFASGGVVDAVSEERSGLLVKPGDYPALTQAILRILTGTSDSWRRRCHEFAACFTWTVCGQALARTMLTTVFP